MNRETFIAKLTEVRQTAQPLAELQALPGDSSWVLEPFVQLAPYSWKLRNRPISLIHWRSKIGSAINKIWEACRGCFL